MKVIYYNRRRLESSEEKMLNAEYVDLNTLLEEADFVSLHVPLSSQTMYLIGSSELKKMKPSAYLINTSRGPVVDEKALLEALKNNEILFRFSVSYHDISKRSKLWIPNGDHMNQT